MLPVATKVLAAAQWRGQAVQLLHPDDRLGDRGTVELEVRHGQGARYQYNVPVTNIVVDTAAAEGTEVRIGLSRGGQAVRVYIMGNSDGQPEIHWKSEHTRGERLHAEVLGQPGRAEGEEAAELSRAKQDKEKRQREAAA